MESNGAGWRKRLAIQLAAQLPEGTEDALVVLGYAQELVTEFLASGGDGYPQKKSVVDQRRPLTVVSESISPSLRAISSGSPSALPK